MPSASCGCRIFAKGGGSRRAESANPERNTATLGQVSSAAEISHAIRRIFCGECGRSGAPSGHLFGPELGPN